jgi:predicted TPR repeat methyltransferase
LRLHDCLVIDFPAWKGEEILRSRIAKAPSLTDADNVRFSALALSIGQEIVVFQPCVRCQAERSTVSFESLTGIESAKDQITRTLDVAGLRGSLQLVRIDATIAQESLVDVSIDCSPRVFSATKDSLDDALAARSTPGGHAALLDMVVSSRLASAEDMALTDKFVEKYATFARDYDAEVRNFPYYGVLKDLVSRFDWSESTLDLGCGTGLLGEIIHEKGQPYTIVGVDLSPDMTAAPAISKYYEDPVRIGPVQAAIMRPELYDHIACFGTLTYLSPTDFTSLMSRMFMVARKSVTFDIEDVSADYFDKSAGNNSILPSYNHTRAFKRFSIPAGWRIVHHKYDLLYHDDLETGCDIYDTMVRIEKV